MSHPRNQQDTIRILREALQEIVEQNSYSGFGDPASRASYAEGVAKAALEDTRSHQWNDTK